MGRVRRAIKVSGRECWTLFDSGARDTYVTPSVGQLLKTSHAMVIDEIGNDEDGRAIEVLFGALAMQQWGIRPVPDEERLDLSHYPEEFVEF